MAKELNETAITEEAISEEDSEVALVKAQIGTLVDDIRHLAKAEIEYIKLRAAYSGNVAKWIGIYGGLAAFCALCTIIALVVGLLLIASIYLGPILATVIVTLAFAAAAFIAAQMAKGKAKELSFGEGDEDE